MSLENVVDMLKRYADTIKHEFPVKMVILQRLYQGEELNPNGQLDVGVVIDLLREDDDYVEVKSRLQEVAKRFDPRFDIDLIEEELNDPTGFFKEIRKTGKVIFDAATC